MPIYVYIYIYIYWKPVFVLTETDGFSNTQLKNALKLTNPNKWETRSNTAVTSVVTMID